MSLDIDAARHDLWLFTGFTCTGGLSAVDAEQCQERQAYEQGWNYSFIAGLSRLRHVEKLKSKINQISMPFGSGSPLTCCECSMQALKQCFMAKCLDSALCQH